MFGGWLTLAVVCFARTPLERLETSHLQAVHAQRVEWMKRRAGEPLPGVYQDFRAILHVHAEDSDHTKGTRAEVLKAAKEDDVRVVMFTDHHGPKADTWRGMRDGVLFIAGAEDDHELRYPSLNLRFLSHVEERPDMPADGFEGMEIYNRHSDATAHPEIYEYIKTAMKEPRQWRRLVENLREYPDEVFAAGTDPLPVFLTRWDREIATHRFTGIGANDAHQNQIFNGVTFDPYAVAFRQLSTHILARELTEVEIRSSLAQGRVYVAHDWLCDPSGFFFIAEDNLGAFDMGDPAPLVNNTRLVAHFPVPAKIRLIHNGAVLAEAEGSNFSYAVKEPGAYRLEAWLTVDGEDRPWIYSNPIYAGQAPGPTLPALAISPDVEVHKDLAYAGDEPAKHKLDVYLPKDKKNFPVMVFFHGGAWKAGDRSEYPLFGNRFAKAGIGVVIPSYRLMPQNPYPAQMEDAAAAFAWVYRNIAQYGGDASRIYVAGHSAGGHLASLLALDAKYLAKYDIPGGAIHGVVSMSGIYNVGRLAEFQGADDDPSPIDHVHAQAPPFLLTYCQWDYLGLPKEARDFAEALKARFVDARLVYIPGESHISEIISSLKDDDASARAILNFVK